MMINRASFRGAARLMLCGAFLSAATQSALANDALLVVKPEAENPFTFDDAALSALPQKEFTTTTIWTDLLKNHPSPLAKAASSIAKTSTLSIGLSYPNVPRRTRAGHAILAVDTPIFR
ncbi:hypothetical protein HKCCA1065_10035 [Rhodobacterales bacterium HKCCA1065]|nr:hypothetical protein [Rhodobacterales bacterium HKCCA1065]